MSEKMLQAIGIGLAVLGLLGLLCSMFLGQSWGFPMCIVCIIVSNAVSFYRHKKYDM